MLPHSTITPQFPRLFSWHVLRNVRQRPLLATLNVLSIGLGVAIYLAIQIANDSANHSFLETVELVAGKAHLELRGEVDERLWPDVLRNPAVRAATAIVEGLVTLPDFPGEFLHIVGIDAVTAEPFQTWKFQ